MARNPRETQVPVRETMGEVRPMAILRICRWICKKIDDIGKTMGENMEEYGVTATDLKELAAAICVILNIMIKIEKKYDVKIKDDGRIYNDLKG